MAAPDRDLTIEERLRLNAELICKQTGNGWREEVAGLMGCRVDDVGAGPVSRTRDSEPLDESNFRVVLRDLQSIDQRAMAERFRHWGVGWIEEIVVPLDNPAVVHRIDGWVSALQDYPIANDDDHAELEAEYAAGSTALDDNDEALDDLSATPDPDPRPPPTTSTELLQRRLDHLTSRASTEPPSL